MRTLIYNRQHWRRRELIGQLSLNIFGNGLAQLQHHVDIADNLIALYKDNGFSTAGSGCDGDITVSLPITGQVFNCTDIRSLRDLYNVAFTTKKA
jgi:hypothetical protein